MRTTVSAELPAPTEHGWYGLMFTDGEGEVWTGAAFWDGRQWSQNVKLAYRRSPQPPFAAEAQAQEWASSQDD